MNRRDALLLTGYLAAHFTLGAVMLIGAPVWIVLLPLLGELSIGGYVVVDSIRAEFGGGA